MTKALPKAELLAHDACGLVAYLLQKRGWMMVTAESCTGGLIAATCTDLAGSSAWFERGMVTYSNLAKTELLGVDPALIARHGAVSEAVVRAMVQGALGHDHANANANEHAHAHAQVAVAVTGVAGPGGGSADKPVGTVWFGFALPGQVLTERCQFAGDRAQVRRATVQHALARLVQLLQAGLSDADQPDDAVSTTMATAPSSASASASASDSKLTHTDAPDKDLAQDT